MNASITGECCANNEHRAGGRLRRLTDACLHGAHAVAGWIIDGAARLTRYRRLRARIFEQAMSGRDGRERWQ